METIKSVKTAQINNIAKGGLIISSVESCFSLPSFTLDFVVHQSAFIRFIRELDLNKSVLDSAKTDFPRTNVTLTTR